MKKVVAVLVIIMATAAMVACAKAQPAPVQQPIVLPLSPVKAGVEDIQTLETFVQTRYVELKNESDKQRGETLKTGNYYIELTKTQRLAEELAARGARRTK